MRIFIGSSTQAIPIMEKVKDIIENLNLDEKVKAVQWTDIGAIAPTYPTLTELVRQTKECHAGIFIFDADEKVIRKNPITGEEECSLVPNNNVIFETGLFCGALGEHNVAIIRPKGNQQIISDLAGVTYISFDSADAEPAKQNLKYWIETNVRGDRPSAKLNNLLIASRKEIHALYPLEKRLGLNGTDMYKHITHIRVLNLAGNLLLTPDLTQFSHKKQSEIDPTSVLWYILQNSSKAMIQILLTIPKTKNMEDAIERMPNIAVSDKRQYIYGSWEKIVDIISQSPFYQNAYEQNRLRYYAFDGVLPYAVFQVEFDKPYAKYNHIKIDLYSSTITGEDARRSFVIWQDTDDVNYTFFSSNAQNVMNNVKICKRLELRKKWQLSQWREQLGLELEK